MDYKALKYLATVYELKSFSEAATQLNVSQSAVSQKVKQLEHVVGYPLLLRSPHIELTAKGSEFVRHYMQVLRLEESFTQAISQAPMTLACSRDILETWVLDHLLLSERIESLNIITTDQEYTLEKVKKGEASIAISTSGSSLSGCVSRYVGVIRYVLVASSAFVEKHFKQAAFPSIEAMIKAPILCFDATDNLNERFFEKYFSCSDAQLNSRLIPSVRGFKALAMEGLGYALIPEIDVQEEIASGALIHLHSDACFEIPLHLVHWDMPCVADMAGVIEAKLRDAF